MTACVLAMTPVVHADDSALAAKLVGAWEGRWEFDQVGGKLTVNFKSSAGDTLKGESTWFGTAVGDFSDSFSKAKVKGLKLKVPESTMDFEATVSEDGTSMEGTWSSPMASGALKLKKKVEQAAPAKP
jgi:hypothetical protein